MPARTSCRSSTAGSATPTTSADAGGRPRPCPSAASRAIEPWPWTRPRTPSTSAPRTVTCSSSTGGPATEPTPAAAGRSWPRSRWPARLPASRWTRRRAPSTSPAPTPSVVTVVSTRTCSARDVSGCAGQLTVTRGGVDPLAPAGDQASHTLYLMDGGENTVSMINTAACNAASVTGCGQIPASFPAGSDAATADGRSRPPHPLPRRAQRPCPSSAARRATRRKPAAAPRSPRRAPSPPARAATRCTGATAPSSPTSPASRPRR